MKIQQVALILSAVANVLGMASFVNVVTSPDPVVVVVEPSDYSRVRVGGANQSTSSPSAKSERPAAKTIWKSSSRYSRHCKRKPPTGFDDLVTQVSHEFGLDPWILAATVIRESGCNSRAVGSVGEIGLAQIYPDVWAATLKAEGLIRKASDLYDPKTNLRAAAWILKGLKARVKSETTMFKRYNGSGPAAERYGQEQAAAVQVFRRAE